jgi:nicotinate-nucleotide pyrophosphorylase (carboxylating)
MFTVHPLSDATRHRLIAGGLDPDAVAAIVRMAVSEDLAGGIDVTSAATVPLGQRSVGEFGARKAGVVAGLSVAAAVIETVCGAEASEFRLLAADGDRVEAGRVVASVEAPTQLLLTAERSALNLLCHISGVATLTRRWADALEGTGAVVRDTRKTLPGLRALQKYGVRCGGGANHRMALSDAALVKDNHVLAAGGVAEAFAAVRRLTASIPVEIEVDSLDGLREAIETWCCSTTSSPRRWRRPSLFVTSCGAPWCSRRAVVSPSPPRAASEKPEWTTSPWASSPIR